MDDYQGNQPEKPKKSIQICKNKRFVWTFTKISNSAVARGFPMISVQAEGPQCPFGLLSAPCRGARVLSHGGNRLGGGAQVRP